VKSFGSLGAFALHLAKLEADVARAAHHGLEKVAVEVEKTAKSQFGHYQQAIGGFDKWPPLKEATKADRARQGYPPDEPLLRSGALRDSITHEVRGLDAVIGSQQEVMAHQELGTSKIPPRPVLGPAALKNRHKIAQILGHATASAIAGTKRLPKYDFET
jgi:phage gpG-like protein